MYSKSFDTMIDEITDSYEEFCKDIDIPNIYKDKDDFKKRYPFDPDNPDSIISNLNRASYFSCVVFLSIVVNHISDSNPYLFVSGLDDTLLSKQNNISDYGRVELNRMLDDGLTFTLSTIRTPASLMESMRDIRLKLPVITMDGAALFNLKEKRYELVYVISPELSRKLVDFFKKTEEPCFINVVVDDLLMIYYEETSIEIYNTIVNSLRSSPYRNYIKRPLPKEENVVYFMLIDDKEKMQKIYDALMKEDFVRDLKVLFYDSTDYAGKAYIKIYNHNASKENMLEYLKRRLEIDRTFTFGTIPNRYDYTIVPGDSNNLIRQIKNRFEPYAWKKS